MDATEKLNWFSSELATIEKLDKDVNIAGQLFIQNLPDYFFTVPASSSGKYHAKFASGEHGLIFHTKAAFYVATELLKNPLFNCFNGDARKEALALLAILLHDGCKRGMVNEGEAHTQFNHPQLITDFIDKQYRIFNSYLTKEDVEFLKSMIITHMGPWTTSKYSKYILPAPKSDAQKFVHMCDYMASREKLEFRMEKTDE